MDLPCCRACLRTGTTFLTLDVNCINNYNLLTNLNVKAFDNKTQFICYRCYEMVKTFIQFRKKCIKSEKILEKRKPMGIKTLMVKLERADTEHTIKEEIEECQIEFQEKDKEAVNEIHFVVEAEENVSKLESIMDEKNDGNFKQTHNKNIIQEKGVLGCGLCIKTYPLGENEKVKMHIESHSNTNQCMICLKEFTEWPAVVGHRVTHLHKEHQSCHICQKHFATPFGLQVHYRKLHYNLKQQKLSCEWCLKTCDTPKNLRNHIRSMHFYGSKVKCDVCHKMFKNRSLLKAHQKVHSENKDYACDDCEFVSKRHQGLNIHIKKAHLKMVNCKHCFKFFENLAALSEHKCNKLPAICPICGKACFSNRLKQHLQRHTDVPAFKCAICPAAFKVRGSLKAHMDRHTGTKRYECECCKMKFYYQSALIKHRRVHTGEKPYVCKTCGRGFTGNYNLKVHMKVHGEYLVKKKSINPKNVEESH